MALTIRNAILHILNNDSHPSAFSEAELDIDSEICEAFIQKHVRKLLDNSANRTAVFKAESEIYNLLREYQNGNIYFKEITFELAKRMDAIMNRFSALPPCDMLITRVGHKSGEYLAILQLNYQAVYVHKSHKPSNGADITENQLITYNALPFSSGKVEDGCLIALDGASMPINLVEKPAIIDGNSVLYFSELFLECNSTPSKKEQAQLINGVTTDFIGQYLNNDLKVATRLKTALIEEATEDDGFVSIDNIASTVFEEQEDIKTQYVSSLREAGVADDLLLGQKVVKQQFAMQRIKAENGVEIRFPVALAADENAMEIITHSDGTVSVHFKNLNI